MRFEFKGTVIYWRGPAPFYFVKVPAAESATLRAASAGLTYGWGCIPAEVELGPRKWSTALMPKDGSYLIPIRKEFRLALELDEGDRVEVALEV